jgi:hypothetical protein
MNNITTTLINDLSTQPYASNVSFNNSWVAVGGANFPLFAHASYITNTDDFKLGQNGVIYADSTSGQITGKFTTFLVVSTCRFSSLSAINSSLNGILSQQLPQGFTFNVPATSFALAYGSVLAYKF